MKSKKQTDWSVYEDVCFWRIPVLSVSMTQLIIIIFIIIVAVTQLGLQHQDGATSQLTISPAAFRVSGHKWEHFSALSDHRAQILKSRRGRGRLRGLAVRDEDTYWGQDEQLAVRRLDWITAGGLQVRSRWESRPRGRKFDTNTSDDSAPSFSQPKHSRKYVYSLSCWESDVHMSVCRLWSYSRLA